MLDQWIKIGAIAERSGSAAGCLGHARIFIAQQAVEGLCTLVTAHTYGLGGQSSPFRVRTDGGLADPFMGDQVFGFCRAARKRPEHTADDGGVGTRKQSGCLGGAVV